MPKKPVQIDRPKAISQSPAGDAVRRRSAIRRYEILDTLPEADFDNLAMLAATICGTQFAAISFIDDDRQWFKAEHGLGIRETPIEQSFCAHAIQQDDIFVVTDASADPAFVDNPLVTGGPSLRFYAGMPVYAANGVAIATLCVIDPVARPEGITPAQATTLRVLAAQVQTQLELRRAVATRDAKVRDQRAMSRRLRQAADHDALTGLFNRTVFNRRLDEAIRDARANEGRVAVLIVDIDHFKQINDSLGHDAGDAMLCSFAARLQATLRSSDTVARLGGDEFAVVLRDLHRSDELDLILHSLGDRLREPIRHAGRQIECRASIGIATYPDHAQNGATLIKCADLALSDAKSTRGCAVMFRREMSDDFQHETKMLKVARVAIDSRRIHPHYQPKIDLATGGLAGFEALVRYADYEAPAQLPEMFTHAFMDRELATAISTQMIDGVLDDMRRWVAAGLGFGHVSINSCAVDFAGNDYGELLLKAIHARGLDPRVVQLEVTEGVFLGRGAHHVARALNLLSAGGVRIALDDFGTGYASLTHLKHFPVDVIKIDKSFVAGLGDEADEHGDDSAIVRALIGLGRSLGIETVAEGIETVAQAAFVKSQGCTHGQGYLFGAACPASEVPATIARFGSCVPPPPMMLGHRARAG